MRCAEVTVYEFGPYVLDQCTFELRRRGERVHIERLAHDFLVYLISHRERVVPPQELLAALWPETSVSRGVLARTAHRAREVLGDDATHPAWIATLRRRGYRFVGEVHERGRAAEIEPSRALARSSHDRYARCLELLDAGSLLALRREMLIGLGQSLRAMGQPETAAHVLRQAAQLPSPPAWRREGSAAS